MNKSLKNNCSKTYKKLLSILRKKNKLHVMYGNTKIPLNIGCPDLNKKTKKAKKIKKKRSRNKK